MRGIAGLRLFQVAAEGIQFPKGSRTQIIGVKGPNTVILVVFGPYSIEAYYLGPWTLLGLKASRLQLEVSSSGSSRITGCHPPPLHKQSNPLSPQKACRPHGAPSQTLRNPKA